ncbi:MAG: mechanosensitive ion channel [Dysgonamonadaceae bacterium]|jgi:small conductance mechanosensitive channel|nr:mechanosensitive ion channel [Dysgonamonadaceae bacterium]
MLNLLLGGQGINPVEALGKSADFSHWEMYLNDLLSKATDFGLRLVACVLIYWVGRKVIRYIDKLLSKLLSGRGIDPSISSFAKSLINVMLTAMLIVGIIAKLGVDTTSFAALVASVGVAIGMAMSGTLQNFSGGIMILLFKPYRIGDYIVAQGQEGTVKDIHIFNTEIVTADNKTVFIPNGGLSSNVIVNVNNEQTRRIDLVVGVEYNTDYDFAKSVALEIVAGDKRILSKPAPFVALKNLGESSVDLLIRVWVKRSDYWNVYFDLNESVYKTFNQEGIGFPFPQMSVHLEKSK